MFQRCTDKARDAVLYAVREAQRAGLDCVGSAEILIGLLQDSTHAAAHMLCDLGMPPAQIEPAVRERIRPGSSCAPLDTRQPLPTPAEPPAIALAPGGKRILELAWDEAQALGCTYIGTEHLLIALVSDNRLLPGRILREHGLELDVARQTAAKWLGADTTPPTHLSAPEPGASAREK